METALKPAKVEIINQINEFLAEEFEVDIATISPEADLKETLHLDSLDYIDLVIVIESNFGFKVKAEDFVGIKTFQNFYDYVTAKLGAEHE
jgi:acyl carrier protein